jgi:hypothetical protein
MDDHERIWFTTPSVETERAFLDEYVLDAVERLESMAACEHVIFIRAGHDPTVDGGCVIVDIYGNPEVVRKQERERWNALVAEGPLTEWERTDTDVPGGLADYYGTEGVRFHERIRALASRLAPLTLRTFDSPPAPVDEFPEEDGEPVGFSRLFHLLCNHQGYTPSEELAATMNNLETSLDTQAQIEGVDAAQQQIDEYIERLDQVREDIETYRDSE